ncbi:MAG: NAD(P)-dependent oxidoreductase [Caldimicrobium sp.]|jgi:D-lactate dehydrogenase
MVENIVFFEAKDWEKEFFIKHLKERILKEYPDLQISFNTVPLNKDTASNFKDTGIAVIYVNSLIDEETLKHLPLLKLIITRSTGMDHIDLLSCKKRNIFVTNVPLYASITVAEHTFALIFALARKLRRNFEKIQKHDFSREGLMGMDLFGKTLGVIGTGNIGSHLCRLGFGIGMKILAFDLEPSRELEEKYKVQYVSLDTLLRESDVITVMVPYYSKTHHLINLENIKLVKEKAMLINTARGPVVDTEALLWALQNGRLQGGIALDVFEGEKLLLEESYLKDSEIPSPIMKKALMTLHLLKYPNVIFTPHIAYYTEEAMERLMDYIIEELKYYLKYGVSKADFEGFF